MTRSRNGLRRRVGWCLLVLGTLVGCGTDTGTAFSSGIRVDEIAVRDLDVSVTETTARITWVSRDPIGSRIEYGTTDALGLVAGSRAVGTTHEVTIEGLAPDTFYQYRVEGRSTIYTFRTLGGTRQRIAFVSDRIGGRREVYLALEWAENATQVTTTGGHSPALSRDGSKLAWVGVGEGGQEDIFACDLDAAGVVPDTTVNLTKTADRTESGPDWSPDNSTVVFVASTPGQASRIILRRVDDGAETVLVDNGAVNDEPVYQPDGSRIAFVSTTRTATYQLARRPLDPGSLAVVVDDGQRTPVPASSYTILDAASALLDFSSSGVADRDVLATYASDGAQVVDERFRVPRPKPEIFTIQPNGDGLRRVTNSDDHQSSPAWFPTDPRLIRSVEVGAATNLYSINADGSSNILLTSGAHHDHSPVVSPDGTAMLFSSNRHEDGLINLYRADFGGEIRELTLHGSGETEPSWSVIPTAVGR